MIEALRGSGRTTRIILTEIGNCLENAGNWVEIKDHDDVYENNIHVTNHVAAILSTLSVSFARSENRILVTPLNWPTE